MNIELIGSLVLAAIGAVGIFYSGYVVGRAKLENETTNAYIRGGIDKQLEIAQTHDLHRKRKTGGAK